MKAFVYTRYGSPDVLEFRDVEKPTPNDNQVLIKICAASVNALDWHNLRATPFLVRLSEGMLKPKNTRLGADVAGRVEAVGKRVTKFKPGDEVFGVCGGAFAEYVCASPDKIVRKPANISFEQAAAVPVAAITALQGLRDSGHLASGQKVLVNGASGGVGSYAVQIANVYGAHVTGVCSTRNLETVRAIGAEQVIDYTKTNFTNTGHKYDLIYDAVGNHTVAEYARALTPNGICVIAGFRSLTLLLGHMLTGKKASGAGGQTIGMMPIAEVNDKDLLVLQELLAAGKIAPVIDSTRPLREVPDSIRYLERGHARGKVVITLAPQNS